MESTVRTLDAFVEGRWNASSLPRAHFRLDIREPINESTNSIAVMVRKFFGTKLLEAVGLVKYPKTMTMELGVTRGL